MTAAVRDYIARKRSRGAPTAAPPMASSGLARHVLRREGMLKRPGERRESRLAKAKARAAREDADDAEASEGGESVEPSGEEGGESESPKEEDDVDDEESTGVKSEDNEVKEETESDNEEVVEEEEPEVTQEITKGDKGKGKGSASQTGVSPVGAGTDLGTTMSSSSTMHNLLAGSLATANAENRQRIRAQLAALAERAANDFLTEDENMDRMALEEVIGKAE